jgi:hypothetical protein
MMSVLLGIDEFQMVDKKLLCSFSHQLCLDDEDDEGTCDARHEQNIENEQKKKEYEAVIER